MFKKIILTSVCSAALLCGVAKADEGQWYGGIDGAYSLLGREEAKGQPLMLESQFNDGWALGLNMGYDFGQFRLEGEVTYHKHNGDRLTVDNDAGLGLATGAVTGGSSKLTSYMVNAIMDLGDTLGTPNFEPFIGAGVGLANLDWDGLRTAANSFTDSSDNVFAYQLFAGVRVPLDNGWEMSLKYRYVDANAASLQDRLNNAFKASYDAHDMVIGLTYRFGGRAQSAAAKMPQPVTVAAVEPAPVMPEPVRVVEEIVPVLDPIPEPAAGPVINMGPYIVHFAWDSARLVGGEYQIVRDAALAAGQLDGVRIVVSGYADRSGSERYNDGISMKRAIAVRDALEIEGVDARAIGITGYGETDPEIATSDGIRNDQNRRVTIILK